MKTLSTFLSLALLISSATLVYAQDQENLFTDVNGQNRYFTSIETLAEEGVISGYSNGEFRPFQSVNRAEALKVILGSFPRFETFDDVEPPTFSDTNPHAWYSPYITEAFYRGIVNGYDDGSFLPHKEVNLVEALKMIFETSRIDLSSDKIEKDLAHDAPASEWFAPYAQKALDEGIIYKNIDGEIGANQPLSRGQLVDLIYRLKHPEKYSGWVQLGNATYYHDMFDGRTTASGEIFDQTLFTAAHLELPFGTHLRVTNRNNNETIEVVVNDRGPYNEHAILDLSRDAFDAIAHLGSGIIPIEIEIINK